MRIVIPRNLSQIKFSLLQFRFWVRAEINHALSLKEVTGRTMKYFVCVRIKHFACGPCQKRRLQIGFRRLYPTY